MKLPTATLLLCAILVSCEPRSFDECILENMRGVSSDVAAVQIKRSCREQFPARAPTSSRGLNSREVAQLSGKAGITAGTQYGGVIYNGNSTITVTQVVVEVTTIDCDGRGCGVREARKYVSDVTIPPMTTQTFGFNIILGGKDATYNWAIAGASGY